jgi:hypothetical protein
MGKVKVDSEEDSEEDLEEDSEVDLEVDLKEATAISASTATIANKDLHRGGKRNALSARRRAVGQPNTQTKNARLHVRNSFLHVTSQVDKHPKTSLCTLQSMKGASTQTSTTRATGTTTTMTTMTALATSNTSNNSSSRSNALQIKHSCITSRATTYTTEARHQHQRHSSCLRTATRDLCTKASYLI